MRKKSITSPDFWPLAVSNFNFIDRARFASFILNKKNHWTRGRVTKDLEYRMRSWTHAKHAIFVGNGSLANSLIANLWAEQFDYQTNGKKIIFPATTWSTSVTPFIQAGFEPLFVDIETDGYNLCQDRTLDLTGPNGDEDTLIGIFPSSLLGQPISRIFEEEAHYNDMLYAVDNCEATFSEDKDSGLPVCKYGLNTTSTYFGHQLQSIEGGFVFTDDEAEALKLRMMMNHGMSRGILQYAGAFDFQCVGNNYRNSDVHAYAGLLDINRFGILKKHREKIGAYFYNKMGAYTLDTEIKHPFCLPLVFESSETRDIVKSHLSYLNIEHRPIVGGLLTEHKAFERWKKGFYPNAQNLHDCGIYVGLHKKVTEQHIDFLKDLIDKIA